MDNGIKTGRLGALSVIAGIVLGLGTAFLVLSAIYTSVTGLIYAIGTYALVAIIWLLTKNRPMGWLWVFACVVGALCPVFIPLLFIGAKRLAKYYPEGYAAPHRAPTPVVSGETNGANSPEGARRGVTPKKGSRFATEEPRSGRFAAPKDTEETAVTEKTPRNGPRFGKTTMDDAPKEPTLFEIILNPDNDSPVELYNSDGKTFVMNQVATVPLGDKMYCLLTPRFPIEGIADGVALGFEMTYVDGEERLMPLDEGEVYDAVYREYEKLFENEK